MTNCDRKYDAVDYFFNEMTDEQRKKFEKHVNECEQCRKQLDELVSVSKQVEKYQRPKPDENLLRQYQRDLENEYFRENGFRFQLEKLKRKFITRPSLGIRLAEAFAILLIGIFIGKMTLWKSEQMPDDFHSENVAITSTAAEALLLNNYLQEAEMILLDVANLDPVADHSLILDLKKIAEYRRLLQKTLLCREHAQQINNEKLGDLINQIELILIELCNIEQVSLDETFTNLKQQLEETNLLHNIKNVNQSKI